MTTIRDLVVDASDEPIEGVDVLIDLLTGITGTLGFDGTGDFTIAAQSYMRTGADGICTADLTANSAITPSGSVYRLTYKTERRRFAYITVPASGGPYWVNDITAQAPGTEGSTLSAAAVTYDNTTSGLTADDVQEAIDELAENGGGGGSTATGGRQKGPLQTFWSALQSRETTPVDILTVGTSITAGTGQTGGLARWQSKLVEMLRRRYPSRTVGPHVANYYPAEGQYGGPTASGTPTPARPTTKRGLGLRSVQLINDTQLLSWGSVVCTTLKVVGYATTIADSFTVNLNSGTLATFTPGTVGPFVQTVTLPLARASNLVQITWVAGAPVIEGLIVNDGDESAGIRLWDSSRGGSKTGDWLTATSGSEDWLARIGSGAATIVTPQLVIVEQLANDYTTISSSQYATNLTSMITKLRANLPDASIVVLGAYRRTTAGLSEAWDAYSAQAKTIAADNDCGYLDLDELVDITQGTGFLFDAYHPSNDGAEVLAGLIFEWLTPPGAPAWTLMKTSPYTLFAPVDSIHGSQRISGAGTGDVTLQVKPAPSQTADIVRVSSADGSTDHLVVDVNGNVRSNSLVARSPDLTAASAIKIDANAGLLRSLVWYSAGVPRWIMRAGAETESGSNAGSSWSLLSRDDNGDPLKTVIGIDRQTGTIAFGDACNFSLGTTTGTKIGTGATQKLAFYGATPVVRPTGWSSNPSGTATRTTFNADTATLGQVAERLRALIEDLRTLGLIGT